MSALRKGKGAIDSDAKRKMYQSTQFAKGSLEDHREEYAELDEVSFGHILEKYSNID